MVEGILKPRLIVVADPNGAGKTSMTEQLLRHEWMGGCEYIHPDFIAKEALDLQASTKPRFALASLIFGRMPINQHLPKENFGDYQGYRDYCGITGSAER